MKKRLSSAVKEVKRGARSAARYARRNTGRVAAGLAGLGLGGYEAFAKYKGYKSPTAAAFMRAKEGSMSAYDYFKNTSRQKIIDDIKQLPRPAKEKVISAATEVKNSVTGLPGSLFNRQRENEEKTGGNINYGKRRRRRRKFGGGCPVKHKEKFGKRFPRNHQQLLEECVSV